jgi:hypothetical protein
MAKTTAHQAANPAANPGFNSSVNTTNWEREQVGFDPYFVIDKGKGFVATLVGRDDTNPKFVRYQFMAPEDMECQRGPNDIDDERHEKVAIKKGDTFNISSFYSLAKLLDQYVNFSTDTGKAITVRVECTGSTKAESGNKVWLWDVRVSPEDKAMLTEWRQGHQPSRLKAGNEARAALES